MQQNKLHFKKTESVNCALCGSFKFTRLFKNFDRLHRTEGEFNIVKCDDCGLVYLNPRPAKKFVNDYYPDAYEPYNIDSDGFYQKLFRSFLNSYYKEKGSVIDWFKGLLCKYFYNPPPKTYKGRILDIGCANGLFLHSLEKQGWDVYGIEMSSKNVQFAKEKLGLQNIKCGMIEDAEYPDCFFDVVSMNHVIEHLFEPKKTLLEVRRILKKGGLVIITTPNIDSINFRIFGCHWFPLETPRHLNLFGTQTMTKLLQDTGLKCVSKRYDVSSSPLVRSIGYVSDSFFKLASAGKFLLIPLSVLAALLGKSDVMTFWGKK
jgi:2-polyprenyl-3-methyl-5-hydroxy-6-metoxy-1,4-benzoquinol methylase